VRCVSAEGYVIARYLRSSVQEREIIWQMLDWPSGPSES